MTMATSRDLHEDVTGATVSFVEVRRCTSRQTRIASCDVDRGPEA